MKLLRSPYSRHIESWTLSHVGTWVLNSYLKTQALSTQVLEYLDAPTT